jgi:CPA2 family monovalent cation:H+ antiporter-2
VDHGLRHAGLETAIVDLNMDTVTTVLEKGRLAVYGDATNALILKAAGITRATQLIITLPHSVNRGPLITTARQLNPGCRIFVRARYLREREELEQLGADVASFEEAEAAVALTAGVLGDLGVDKETIAREIEHVRTQTVGESLLRMRANPA